MASGGPHGSVRGPPAPDPARSDGNSTRIDGGSGSAGGGGRPRPSVAIPPPPPSLPAGGLGASVRPPLSGLHPPRSQSESALVPTFDYSGWMVKSAPRSFDCDKVNTLQRRMSKLVRPRAFVVPPPPPAPRHRPRARRQARPPVGSVAHLQCMLQ
jgi:hypothetical protein